MSNRAFPRIALAFACLGPFAAPVAEAQGTRDDFARAEALPGKLRGKVFRDRVEPHWFAGDGRFWYRNDLKGGAREFIEVIADPGVRRRAFDHARLAEQLSKALGRPVGPDTLPIDAIAIDDDGSIRFEAGGKGWRYRDSGEALEPAEPPRVEEPAGPDRGRRGGRRPEPSPRAEASPDGAWSAIVKDHNLVLRRTEGGEEFPVTTEGTEADGYEPRVFWSPDSSRLVALRTARGDDRKVFLVESSPKDQLQPKLQSYDYLKPGDRLPITRPHLIDVGSRKAIPIKEDLFGNPWSIDEYRWDADSSRFTFLYNQRGHQVLRLVAVDAKSGEATPLIDETSPTFVDYSNKTFLHHVEGSDDLIWMSERDGWNHLYRIDSKTGAVKNPITSGDWVVRAVDRVDDDRKQVWFRALGIRPGQDPYQVQYARVDLDGKNLVILTEGDGNHAVRFSPDRRFLIDAYSRVDLPPVTELRRASDGGLICELERADISGLIEAGWRAPERFEAKGRDGKTAIYGIIAAPSNLDPSKKYPVIEQIYAGPHGAFVPKGFSPYLAIQGLAELGFVVVQIDGMGTNWRSRAFHDVCWKNLADAGFPDRIAWLKAAAGSRPFMDLERVGIYGGSAGGQNALGAVLFHPDFYKAAAADCGCHDNRMDKIWWNEAWMGWPVGLHYAEQSNATNAHRLRGALLLTVGETDHNVDPASTMQVVDALIRAGKDFDLVVFPGRDHGAGGTPYGDRKRRDFFVRHLLGVEPPPRNAAPSGG